MLSSKISAQTPVFIAFFPFITIPNAKSGLKELRETRINLRIIKEKPIITNEKLQNVLLEVNQLIAIFSSSISTAKKIN
jgi:hypothetical protein